MSSLAKQLMEFIKKERLMFPHVHREQAEIATFGWKKSAEAEINKFVDKYAEGIIGPALANEGCHVEAECEMALTEFPDECRAILHQDGEFVKDEYGNWYIEDESGSLMFPSEDELMSAALRWLAGKKAIRYFLRFRSGVMYWPADSLGRVLGEVRRQRKQEKEG